MPVPFFLGHTSFRIFNGQRRFAFMRRCCLCLLVVACLWASRPGLTAAAEPDAPAPVPGQEQGHDQGQNDPLRAAPLPEIIVSASAEPVELRTLSATVQVIDAAQIRKSGAVTLDQVLDRYVPGSGYIQPGALSAVGMRGFRSNQQSGNTISDRVLVLIDGHRAGTGNPSVLPLANVERIEVVRGPASVIYGGSAMGGVINLITKRGKGKATGSIGGSYGTYRKTVGEAAVSGGLDDDRWGFAIAVQGYGRDDYEDARGRNYENTATSNVGGSGTITLRPVDGTSISLVGIHQLDNAGSPGEHRFSRPDDTINNVYSYLALEYDAAFSGGHTLRASLYGTSNAFTFYDGGTFFPGDTGYLSKTGGGRAVYGLPLGEWGRLSLGADYAHTKDDSVGDNIWMPNAAYDVVGVFAEYRHTFGPVSVNSGVRYDNYTASLRSTSGLRVSEDTTNWDHVSWNAGATWWLTDWLGLRAAAGTAFVPPTAKARSGEFVTPGFWGERYVGNSSLEPEKSFTVEGGLEVEYKKLRASATFFHTVYTDRIIENRTRQFGTVYYENSDTQYLEGLNLSASYSHDIDLGGTPLTLSPYVSSEVYTRRECVNSLTPVLSIPTHSTVAGLGVGYRWAQLDVNMRFTGEQEQYDMLAPTRRTSMDAFETLNARLTVTPMESLSVFVDVDNITNRQYAWTNGYPMPGRTVSVGFKYTF